MSDSGEKARQQAINLAADTMGELITFWGFKSSMGRIWTLLYLSEHPLPADEISTRCQLSSGSVSMALSELSQWGIVERAVGHGRKKHYQAETDVWGMIRRIVRERELRLVGRSVERFEKAVKVLQVSQRSDPSPKTAFMIRRLQGLLMLTKIGYGLVESFADQGFFSLSPIRNALGGEDAEA